MADRGPEIVLIAALGRNGEIGRDGELLWHIPGDLPRFKSITMGYPIIMGRKTFESIGRPLPGRENIVLTRNPAWQAEGVQRAGSVEEAMQCAGSAERVFVIGGAEIYSVFLDRAHRLELTLVDDEAAGADAWFPDFSDLLFAETAREAGQAGGPRHEFVTLVRSAPGD